MQYISFDCHKRYTFASVERAEGGIVLEGKISHAPEAFKGFLSQCEPGSPVAVETVGNWYWIVDEIERLGFRPLLVHARKAKLCLALYNKTDKLDARGLNRLQRTGTLPTVWIPSADLRDMREIPRTRMLLVKQRTQLKNRIQSALAKYGQTLSDVTDVFGKEGMKQLKEAIGRLPAHTASTTRLLLAEVKSLERKIDRMESQMKKSFKKTPEVELLMTLPGVGFILAVVMALEIGEVSRFLAAERLASYAGCVPRVHSSGGKTRYGPVRPDVNRYLKWAFVEAGNSICRMQHRLPLRHASLLYRRVAAHKGHQKAIIAVGRHLAEAAYWVLSKKETYRDPVLSKVLSTEA